MVEEECHNIILLCCDNDQENGSRVLSQQSNLCRDIKRCILKDFCRDKGKLCHDKKWKGNEISQDKFVATKISMFQQTVQLATKIKEGNMLRHFKGLSRHRVQI